MEHEEKEILKRLLRETEENTKQQARILHIVREIKREIKSSIPASTLTKSIANRFSGDSIMANNALVFNVGQTSIDTITPLLADGVTPSGGVVSGLTVTFSDPSATAAVSGANTVVFTGVAASAAPISGSVGCTVTDSDGATSTWTQAFTVQTNAVAPPPPPSQLTQSIANVFSTPTP